MASLDLTAGTGQAESPVARDKDVTVYLRDLESLDEEDRFVVRNGTDAMLTKRRMQRAFGSLVKLRDPIQQLRWSFHSGLLGRHCSPGSEQRALPSFQEQGSGNAAAQLAGIRRLRCCGYLFPEGGARLGALAGAQVVGGIACRPGCAVHLGGRRFALLRPSDRTRRLQTRGSRKRPVLAIAATQV
jgi:hypothetical protein